LLYWQLCTLLVLMSGACLSLNAQNRTPTYSNEFNKLGIGAGNIAAGFTGTAGTSDLTATYWNPAGLALLSNRYSIGFSHYVQPNAISQQTWFGFATQLPRGSVVAVTFLREGINNNANTLDINRGGSFNFGDIKPFASNDYQFTLSYAQRTRLLKNRLSFGGNLKIINRRQGEFVSGWGVGIDAGARMEWKNASLGVVLSDFTPTVTAWTFNTLSFENTFRDVGLSVPQNRVEITLPSLRIGGQYRVCQDKLFRLNVMADILMQFDGSREVPIRSGKWSLEPRVGFTASWKDYVYLSSGAVFDSRQTGVGRFTAGLGGGYRIFRLDYAAVMQPKPSAAWFVSHVVSLRFYFGKRLPDAVSSLLPKQRKIETTPVSPGTR
jgi:hypothetical protein